MRESRTLEYKENLSSNTFLKTISALPQRKFLRKMQLFLDLV